MNFLTDKNYFNKKNVYYVPKINWGKLNENKINPELIKDFPVNKEMKYDRALMIKAIQFGMMILIKYRGDKDRWRGGRERVICPMVLGKNTNTGNELLRAWHFDGWSVSMKKNTKLVWRLFKTVNILSMTFVGDFFKVPPQGYKRNDRVMTEITYIAADFHVISKNQYKLVQQGLIEEDEETQLQKEKMSTIEIKAVEGAGEILNLQNVWDNPYFDKKKSDFLKVSFLKSVVGNEFIAILGAVGVKGGTVKIFENNKLKGSYKVIQSFPDPKSTLSFVNQIRKFPRIENKNEWKLYTFVKKRS